jgi:hypothetical protein
MIVGDVREVLGVQSSGSCNPEERVYQMQLQVDFDDRIA